MSDDFIVDDENIDLLENGCALTMIRTNVVKHYATKTVTPIMLTCKHNPH